MYNVYNLEAKEQLDNFLKSFKNFLIAEKVASVTQRSYVSDARFFLNWYLAFLQNNLNLSSKPDFSEVFKMINAKVLSAYNFFLVENKIPLKSINRKFSALRKLGSFCLIQNLFSENVFENLKNLSDRPLFPEHKCHLGQFKDDLLKRNLTKITVKNYLVDTKQFLDWNKNNFKL